MKLFFAVWLLYCRVIWPPITASMATVGIHGCERVVHSVDLDAGKCVSNWAYINANESRRITALVVNTSQFPTR